MHRRLLLGLKLVTECNGPCEVSCRNDVEVAGFLQASRIPASGAKSHHHWALRRSNGRCRTLLSTFTANLCSLRIRTPRTSFAHLALRACSGLVAALLSCLLPHAPVSNAHVHAGLGNSPVDPDLLHLDCLSWTDPLCSRKNLS